MANKHPKPRRQDINVDRAVELRKLGHTWPQVGRKLAEECVYRHYKGRVIPFQAESMRKALMTAGKWPVIVSPDARRSLLQDRVGRAPEQ